MEVKRSDVISGSLQISTDVIARIAKLATMEIEGVHEVSVGSTVVKSFFNKVSIQHPVQVVVSEGVAEITVCLIVEYGAKIPPVCEKVQENVKNSVQNMTGITVSKVNVSVTGVAPEKPEPTITAAEEE